MGITDIAEVVGLCPGFKMGIFGFHKITDFHPCFQNCAWAQAGMGADNTACLYHRPFNMAKRFDLAIIADFSIFPDNNIRLDNDILAKLCIGRQVGCFRVYQRYPTQHCLLAKARLYHRFHLGQLQSVIYAGNLFLRYRQKGCMQTCLMGHSDQIC